MAQRLSEWDRDTAPHLGRIEECMARAEYYLDQAIIALSVLKQRPSFETKAEASLLSMRQKINEAITTYHSIPQEMNNG